jgi:Ca2+-binding EF-hand superfamily protein
MNQAWPKPLNTKNPKREEIMMVNGVNGGGYDVTSIWQTLFDKIDQNGDGAIDKAEMESILSKNGPSVEDIFTKLDSDQDGVIGKNEYQEAPSKMRSQQPPGPPPVGHMGAPSPEEIFNRMDQDSDGSITKEELKSVMAQMPQNGPSVDEIFEEVDTDKDGVISRSESDAHLEKMQEERKGGPPPDLMMKKGSDGLNWESMMIERLLNSYDLASNESNESTPLYA